jgi:hypothetical protein
VNKALQILKKKNYVVKVERVGEYCDFKVTYPPFNIYEKKCDEFSKNYSVGYSGDLCVVTFDGESLELPHYLARLAILVDIYSQCHYAQINPSLICYFNTEGKEVKDFFELAKDMEPSNPACLTKELTIYKMLVGEEVPVEEQIKVFRAWKLMKGLSL